MNYLLFYASFLTSLQVLDLGAAPLDHENVRSMKTYLESTQNRIIGGSHAEINNFPFVVSVQKRGRHTCGGSLYSTSLVITASHCVYSKDVYLQTGGYETEEIGTISTLIGTTLSIEKMLPDDAERRGVLHIFGHKSFKFKSLENDIAILKLSYPVRLTDNIQLVPMPSSVERPETGKVCTALGWGITKTLAKGAKPWGTSSPKLLQVDLNVDRMSHCQSQYRSDAMEDKICTLSRKKDTCSGDSGGPLVCNGVLMGITSYGKGCAMKDIPGVFQRIDIHMPWVKETEARSVNATSRKYMDGALWLTASLIFSAQISSMFYFQ